MSAECSDKKRKVKGVYMKSLIHRSELQNMFTSNWQAIELLCCDINQNKLFCFQLLSAQHSPLFIFATNSTNLPPMASLRLILRSSIDHSSIPSFAGNSYLLNSSDGPQVATPLALTAFFSSVKLASLPLN